MPSEFGEMPAEGVELSENPSLGPACVEPEEPVTLVDQKSLS